MLGFSGGAYRFNQEHTAIPQEPSFAETVINLTGTFGLFSLFYVAGVNIWSTDVFYALILLLHIYDTIWFTAFVVKFHASPLSGPAGHFLALNFIAFGVSMLLLYIFWDDFWNQGGLSLQYSVLILLTAISIFDWSVLRKFYFHPTQWRDELVQEAAARAADNVKATDLRSKD